MIIDRLNNEYFDWMYNLVCGEQSTSYRKLLSYLHSRTFRYIDPMDENRYSDGIELRYYYGDIKHYQQRVIATCIDSFECSVLEMMVALANRCENEIMQEVENGYRPDRWFFVMLESLGIADQDDDHFNRDRVEEVIDIFLDRDYKPNGKGGLFTLHRPKRDLRNVEIWCQLMWYLNELED